MDLSREMYESSAPARGSGFFQISSSIDNIKYVFVYFKEHCLNANDHRQAEVSPHLTNTFSLPGGASLSSCRLDYGREHFFPRVSMTEKAKYGSSTI